MKHYGDITKLHGWDLPVVDCITGGSPCQDLSVAGNRAGLSGERSGLFMDQIRIVKEMREYDRAAGRTDIYVRPRFMVWENVAGSLSSPGKGHEGEDFQAVLTEIVKVICKDAPDVPLPDKGKWSKSGCLMGYGDDGCPFSIAWRLHDAQFWGPTQYIDGRMWFRGTPQRRKRIALVADFGGVAAPEILFIRKGMSRDYKPGKQKEEGIAGGTEDCPGGASVYGISPYDSQGMKSSNPHAGIYKAKTARTLDNNGGNPCCYQGGVAVIEGNGSRGSHKGDGYRMSETMYTLNSVERHAVYRECLNPWNVQSKHTQPEDGIAEALYAGECRYGGGESNVLQGEVAGTLDANYYKGCGERQGVERTVVVDKPRG